MVHLNAQLRRQKRFDMASTGSTLARIERGGACLMLRNYELLNLSFGGMCFRSTEELEPEGLYDFLIDLRAPIRELVFVRCNIRWVQSPEPGRWIIGAAVVESSRGWLGAFAETTN